MTGRSTRGRPRDHVQVQLEGNVLPVGVTEGSGDRMAGGGQRAGALGGSDDLGGDDVPDVGQRQDLRRLVQFG